MAKPEIDWTFAEAPTDELPADSAAPAAPPPPRPPSRWRAWLGRQRRPQAVLRWLALAGFIVAGAAGAAWVVTRVGEQRVRAQLTAEVVYEDTQALAGAANLALGVWADPASGAAAADLLAAWRERRTAEIGMSLAAPLPLAGLTPAAGAPQLTEVAALPDDPNLWVATVVRTYTDSAGQALSFALPQRYQFLGPGLWQRLPPDMADLANTTVVSGFRLSATLPVADLPWLSDSLFAADAALVRACADWGADACGDQKLLLLFTAQPAALPPVQPATPGLAAGFGPYPLAFDLAPLVPYDVAPVILAAPQVAGRPVDAAARAALTHALVVYGLTALVNAQAGPTTRAVDYFRDALVARAEQRLGLTGPLTYTLRGADYLPIMSLWQAGTSDLPIPALTALPLRLQALQFLNLALAEQPPSAEAALLRVLRRRPDLNAWLSAVLGNFGATQARAGWDQQAAEQLGGGGALPAAALEGLAYTCDGQGYLVRAGQTRRVSAGVPWPGLGLANQALAADGRYLAQVAGYDGTQAVLTVWDLAAGADADRLVALVAQAPELYVLGWSAAQTLVYVQRDDHPPADSSVFYLMGYDLAARQSRRLSELPVAQWFLNMGDWLPDQRHVLVTLDFGDAAGQPNDPHYYAPALVVVDDGSAAPERLADQGFASLASPDGRRFAYATLESSADGNTFTLSTLVVAALDSGDPLFTQRADALPPTAPDALPLVNIVPLGWSGDSAWLAVLAIGNGGGAGLYLLAADGHTAPLPLGSTSGAVTSFVTVGASADGRYLSYSPLAAVSGGGAEAAGPLTMVDLEAVARAAPAASAGWVVAQQITAAAWAPTGHRLAVAGPAGLRMLDLDTGLTHWLDYRACETVSWYPPPAP